MLNETFSLVINKPESKFKALVLSHERLNSNCGLRLWTWVTPPPEFQGLFLSTAVYHHVSSPDKGVWGMSAGLTPLATNGLTSWPQEGGGGILWRRPTWSKVRMAHILKQLTACLSSACIVTFHCYSLDILTWICIHRTLMHNWGSILHKSRTGPTTFVQLAYYVHLYSTIVQQNAGNTTVCTCVLALAVK